MPQERDHERDHERDPERDPESSGEVVLRARGVSADFGRVRALRDVDLDVHAGEIVGLAGDNGAGKTTLLRCIFGDVTDARGDVWVGGKRITPGSTAGRAAGRIGVVWQHVELADNLDVAANLALGRERRTLLSFHSTAHLRARAMLEDLGIPIADSTRPARALTAAERQLVAVAQAVGSGLVGSGLVDSGPRLLLLDEPTAVLNRDDSARVERLLRRCRADGTAILLVSHDVDQLFRLADRIVVLRRGRRVAQVDPRGSHPDELLALMAGHDALSAPRRELGRLHALADQLSAATRPDTMGISTGLTLILSTLGAALGVRRLSLHQLDDGALRCVAAVGLAHPLDHESTIAQPADGPLWRAVRQDTVIVDTVIVDTVVLDTVIDTVPVATVPVADAAGENRPGADGSPPSPAAVAGLWAVPFAGGSGTRGVIGIWRESAEPPAKDELDLINLYAGFAASTMERERLVGELTAHNRVLETIRAVLEVLAGPGSLADGIATAVQTVRASVAADAVGLYESADGSTMSCRAFAGAPGITHSVALESAVGDGLRTDRADPHAQIRSWTVGDGRLLVRLSETMMLAAQWPTDEIDGGDRALLEAAAHSILLALERERAESEHREVTALLRSRELQNRFLTRLSHELRTPLTAIQGFASTLMQTDVTWDAATQTRFLGQISGESARLRRLVDDLLDFSLIESGMLRVRPDWVDVPMVAEAAVACLPPTAADCVQVRCADDVPAIWADHDRLEQVLVNLMDNAVRHNPSGTAVQVDVHTDGAQDIVIAITDDGVGFPVTDEGDAVAVVARRRSRSGASAGIGLRITEAIVHAHHGTIRREPALPGTRFVITLPVESVELVKEPDDV